MSDISCWTRRIWNLILHCLYPQLLTCDVWHVTCDVWHVTCDMWHLFRNGGGGWVWRVERGERNKSTVFFNQLWSCGMKNDEVNNFLSFLAPQLHLHTLEITVHLVLSWKISTMSWTSWNSTLHLELLMNYQQLWKRRRLLIFLRTTLLITLFHQIFPSPLTNNKSLIPLRVTQSPLYKVKL